MSEAPSEINFPQSRLENPFDPDRQVDESFFVEREAELRQALAYLKDGRNVWILGAWGSGKTSLLTLIERRAPSVLGDDARVLRMDLGLENDETKFLESLARRLGLPQDATAGEIQKTLLMGQRVLLLVDEFDLAYQAPGFPPGFLQILRSLIETKMLQMAVASTQVGQETRTKASPLSARFEVISLGGLGAEAARAFLLRTAQEAGISFDPTVVDRAVELAAGQPRRLMSIGYALVENNQDWDKASAQYHEMMDPAIPRQKPVDQREPTPAGLGYTPEAARVLLRADGVRESTAQPFIYTAHLLAALYLSGEDSPAFAFLSTLSIERSRLLQEVLHPQLDDNALQAVLASELPSDPLWMQQLRLSEFMSAILADAQERAKKQEADEVSALHLFASLMENREAEAARWLENALGLERYDWTRSKLAEAPKGAIFNTARVQALAIAAGLYQPPTGMDDEAAAKDLLNFKRYTDALASIILKPETRPPLVVGVYGPWGSGKSTFLKLVKESLQPTKKPEKARWWQRPWQFLVALAKRARDFFIKKKGPELLIIEYNAWEYTDAPKLWAGLVAKVARKIDERLGWRGRMAYLFKHHLRRIFGALVLGLIPVALFLIALYFKVLGNWIAEDATIKGWVTTIAGVILSWYLAQKEPVTTVVKALTTKFDAAPARGVVHEIQEELDHGIKTALLPEESHMQPGLTQAAVIQKARENEFKIVVFIDELDRCPLERIVDILEAIKLFLAQRCFIVLIAIDTRVAAEAIRLHYRDVENADLPHEYLEKIVQLPLQVPTADKEDLEKYLQEHMPGYIPRQGAAGPKPPAGRQPGPRDIGAPPAVRGGERNEPHIALPARGGQAAQLQLPDTPAEFEHIVTLGKRLLESNPRRIKRLLNTYRYIKVLASKDNRPVYDENWQRTMLAWLAFTMRWPAFMGRAIEAARHEVSAGSKPFLVQVSGDVKVNLDRPSDEEIRELLPIDYEEVYDLGLHASNFLIETPPHVESRAKQQPRPSRSRPAKKTAPIGS